MSAVRGESIPLPAVGQRGGMQGQRLPEHLCAGHAFGHGETDTTRGKESFGWKSWSWKRGSCRNLAASKIHPVTGGGFLLGTAWQDGF